MASYMHLEGRKLPWRAQVKRKGHGTMVKHFVCHTVSCGEPIGYLGRLYPSYIHSANLLEELHELGIPSWVDQYHLSQHHDPNIKTRQIKINGVNKNGYEWSTFFNTWKIYIKEKEVKDIEEEIGMATKK